MPEMLEIAEAKCDPGTALMVSELIFDLFSESGLIVSADEESGDCWRVEVILPPDRFWAEFEPTLNLAFPGLPAFSVRYINRHDWATRPQPARAPVRAGRFYIHEEDQPAPPAGSAIPVTISAGMAFGTGHHETTSGCLIALENVLRQTRPRAVLDLGCGTAILAVAFAKAARAPVLASDIDPVAVAVARRNGIVNGVGPLLRCVTAAGVRHREIAARAPYDLIMANILAGPLMAMATPLAALLAPGARLILSGLLLHQAPRIIARYRAAGLVFQKQLNKREWATLTLAAPGRPF
ncbi:MAG: 50S ribosomal protein L11 methyltransferase [Rhodobiaceae bacterium]|nr:50S ribosomal protein L11 methyltransferase [Rhodobiaceae bacterium]